MIRVGADKNVYINDTNYALFKIECYFGSNAEDVFYIDFDPCKFIEGGSLSTGNLIKDMVNYTRNILEQIYSNQKDNHGEVNILNHNTTNIVDYITNLYPEKGYVPDHMFIKNLDFTDDFETKFVSETIFFGLLFFKLKKFNGVQTNGILDISDIIDMCYQIFLYTYSPTYRRLLTARAIDAISSSELKFKISSVACWDDFFNDYVITPTIGEPTFMPKHIFNCGSGNTSVSNYSESLDVISKNSISLNMEIDLENDITFYTSRPIYKEEDDYVSYSNIAEINAYKMVDKTNMLGCSLSIEYKDKYAGGLIDTLFRDVYNTKIFNIIELSKLADQTLLEYKNLPLDKNIDTILNMEHITLGLKFRNFNSNGAGKSTGMDLLSKSSYKIKPVERRDTLYTLCCNIFKSIGANVNLGFKNLDVGFKTHYNYIKEGD